MAFSISAGAPDVFTRETDLSQIIPAVATSVAAIVGESNRGPANRRTLVSNTKDFIDRFGNPDPKISYMHYCALAFLEHGTSLYVTRVTGSGAAYAGVQINSGGSIPAAVVASLTDPSSYAFTTEARITETVGTGDSTTVSFAATASNIPITVSSITIYVNGVQVATDDGSGAIAGATGTTNIGTSTIDYTTGVLALTFTAGNAPDQDAAITWIYTYSTATGLFLAYSENQGTWGNSLKVKIENVDTTDNTFDIVVIEEVEGINITRERHTVSRQTKLDGFGRQLFLENKINGSSAYIKVEDNGLAADTMLPTASNTSRSLAGGVNGSAATIGEVSMGWDNYSNPEEVDVNLLINAGYVGSADFVVQSKMRSIANSRKDCFAILDSPFSELSMTNTALTTWRRSVQNFNDNYCGLYASWVRVYDTYNDLRDVSVPPSGFVAGIMALTDNVRAPWYAPAGLNRGILRSGVLPVLGLSHKYTDTQRDLLYQNQVNFLRDFLGDGRAVWGQKTMQTKASALDRINVRRLLITIQKAIAKALRYSVFELNNEFTRASVKQSIDLYMEDVQSGFGVYRFLTVCDTTNNTFSVIDRNEFLVDLYLAPQKVGEFVLLQSIITRSDAFFEELVVAGTF